MDSNFGAGSYKELIFAGWTSALFIQGENGWEGGPVQKVGNAKLSFLPENYT